jgi:transposase
MVWRIAPNINKTGLMSSQAHDLPADIDALRALILVERAQHDAERATAKVELAARDAKLAARQVEIEHLKMVLAKLRRQRFGQSSEKLDAEIHQLELWVDDAEIGLATDEAKAASAEQAQPQSQQTPKPPRKPAVRKPLPDHLPREIVVLEPIITCRCGDP